MAIISVHSEMLFLEPDLCRHNNYMNLACSCPEYYTTKATSTINIMPVLLLEELSYSVHVWVPGQIER